MRVIRFVYGKERERERVIKKQSKIMASMHSKKAVEEFFVWRVLWAKMADSTSVQERD